MSGFDLTGARQAGYDDAEIASFLAPQIGFDLAGAKQAGYSDTEIVDHLAPPPPVRSAPGELLTGFKRGAFGQFPQQIGQALKWFGDEPKSIEQGGLGSTAYEIGQSLENVGTDYLDKPENQLNPAAHNWLTNALSSGAEMVVPSVAPAAIAVLLPETIPAWVALGIGATSMGAMYGGSQAQQTYEKAIKSGLTPDAARKVGIETGAYEAGGEILGTMALGYLFGTVGRGISKVAGVDPVEGVFAAIQSPAYFKDFLKKLPAVYGTEIGTEMGQNAAEAWAEQRSGIPTDISGGTPWEQAQQAVAPTFGMTTLLAPFGLYAHRQQAKQTTVAAGALQDQSAPQEVRTAAAGSVYAGLKAVDKPFADQWYARAKEAIANGQPVGLDKQFAQPTPEAKLPGSDFDRPLLAPQAQAAVVALDQAQDVDTAIAAAQAIVDAPVAPIIAAAQAEAPVVQPEQQSITPQEGYVAPDELLRRVEEWHANRRLEGDNNIADLDKIEAEIAGEKNAVQEPSPGTLDVRNASANGEGVGVENRPVQPAAVQPAAQATESHQQPNALTDDEIARQMTASIPENFTPATPLPAATPAVTIMGATPDKLTTPELRISAEAAAKPEQRQAAAVELDRRAQAYKLRGQLTPEHDSLFTAIAKLGGLNKKDVVSSWGVDPADVKGLNQIFGKPLLRTTGGLSIDGMAELLVQHGYLDQRDLQEFERKFDQELRGKPVMTPAGYDRQAQAVSEASNEHVASLELTPEKLVAAGYDKLSDPEQEQVQAILDAMVESARGKPYEALVDAILERAIAQTEGRPFMEYAKNVIAQIKEVINAQSTDNQPAQAVSGTSSQGDQSLGEGTRAVRRPAAAQQVAGAELALTGQTAAEVKAQGAAAQREAAAKKQREAAPPPEEFTLAGSNRQADQARAHGQQELVPSQPNETQPWQMTREEFVADRRGKLAETKNSPSAVSASKGVRFGQEAAIAHRERVKKALSEGQNVPSEVLADYPDLDQIAPERQNAGTSSDMATQRHNLPAERQQLFVEYGNQRAAVSSLEEASQKWGQFRKTVATEHGVGASAIGSGARIVDPNGKEVARISYNGKVWPPGEWHSGMKPLVGENFKPSPSTGARVFLFEGTPTKQLQQRSREAEGAELTAIEDELNRRAEEKAQQREERLAKGRAATKPVEKTHTNLQPVKRFETPGAKEAVDAAEAELRKQGIIEQPTKEYNDASVQGIYDNADTRPGTTFAQKEEGIGSLRGWVKLGRLYLDRAQGSLLGSAMWRDFVEHKGAELVGKQAGSAEELALLAQVLRDPRWETFRVFFTKGDKIVGHTATTSRLAAVTAFTFQNKGESTNDAFDRRITELQALKDSYGADGYWLMHNHPSGTSTPSNGDIRTTKDVVESMVGFKGHVIIDHDEFSLIDAQGRTKTSGVESGPRHSPAIPHDLLGKEAVSAKQVFAIGQQIQAKTGWATVITTDAEGRVQQLYEIAESMFDGKRGLVRARQLAGGANGVFIVSDTPEKFDHLIQAGLVTDAVGRSGPGTSRALNGVARTSNLGYKTRVIAAEQMQWKSASSLEQRNKPYIADSKTTGDYKDTFAAKATDFMTNYFTSFDKIGWWQKTVGTPFNLALTNKEFAPFYDEGQAYINDISRYGNESADLAQDLLPRVEHFRDVLPAWLGGKTSAQRGDVMAASKALYAGTLWGGGSPMEGRVWTDAELKSGRAMDNGVSIPAFQPMSTKQIALYRQALAATSKSMDELAKSLIQRIARQADVGFDRGMSLEDVVALVGQQLEDKLGAAQNAGNEALVKELIIAKGSVADIADKAKSLNEAGYFPAQRFGKYALHVVKGGKQLYFGMYESKAQALVAEQKLKQEFPGAEIQKGIIPKEKYKLFQGLSLDALEAFSDYIVDAEGNKVAKDALVQGLLKAATAERSVMKRHIHRKGIPGYSEDVPRVLASFVVSSARAIASTYHAAEMLKLAQDIKAGDVSDYAAKLARYMLDPVEEAQGLRGFLFAQYLGGSIASGLVNMTQPWMVTAPWMSHYTSYADAVAKLGKAGAENADALTGKIGDAYKRAKREGIVTPQEIHQLRAETGGGIGARSLALRKLSFAWGSIFSLAEQWNRKATFLAAYRIAEAMSKEDKAKHGIGSSYDFAKQAVAETQFTYNKGNRPVFSRGMLGATVMTFKQFSISYLEMAHRLYKTDKKAFALLALTLLAAGGIEGLPFADDLEDLVDTMGQWLGYATNSKKKVRQWAMTILGPDLSQVALRGVSGLSWMPVDISQRMGMANLIPGTAALKPSEKNKTRDVVEMLGPAGQFLPLEGTMMGNALERLGKGDIGGAIKAAAPQAIQAAVKGGEMLETGKATDLRGRKITEVSPGEAVLKMAGLQPASVARESQKIGIVQQDIDMVNRMKAEVAEQWARGIVDKEPDQVKAARQKMADWNSDNPELRIHVDSKNVLPRIKEMRMTREERFTKHAPKEIRTGVREALR